jgi:uncharacterized protein (DUF58 family)
MTGAKRLYLLLALTIVPMAGAAFFPDLGSIALTIDAVILLLFLIDRQFTPSPKLLQASRHCEERLSIGRKNQVKISLTNLGYRKLKCQVKDDFPFGIECDISISELELGSQESQCFTYNLHPRRRGAYQFGNLTIRYLSFLGLFWQEAKFSLPQKVSVYADLKALHDLSIKLSHSSELGELHQKKRGQGTDFASLREYTFGDDSRAIDWKATARRDRPVIRTYEAEQEQRMLILIDAGRMMLSELEGLTRFDRALNAALCLALTGLHQNDQVGLGIFADKPLLYLPPKRGKGQMNRILEATFPIEPKMVEPDYASILAYFAQAQKGRSLMVILTDLTDPTGSQALLNGMAKLSPRHLPFCVTLKDRSVGRLANLSVEALEHEVETRKGKEALLTTRLYKRAIAQDLISQRELALSVLTRRGCIVLDSPPQELSDRLVDSYLELKARAKL